VQVTVTGPAEKPDGDFNGLVVNGEVLADNAPEWIRLFGGIRLVIRSEAQNLVWADDATQAGQFIQQLAEGEAIGKEKHKGSVWMIVVYIFAALFALQVLLLLLVLGISLVTGF
jgi:hypothetical protein